MKYSYLKLSLWSLLFVGLSNGAIAQATNGVVNNNVFQSGYFLGWNGTNGANPLLIKTNNITDLNPYAVFGCYCIPIKSSTLTQ